MSDLFETDGRYHRTLYFHNLRKRQRDEARRRAERGKPLPAPSPSPLDSLNEAEKNYKEQLEAFVALKKKVYLNEEATELYMSSFIKALQDLMGSVRKWKQLADAKEPAASKAVLFVENEIREATRNGGRRYEFEINSMLDSEGWFLAGSRIVFTGFMPVLNLAL